MFSPPYNKRFCSFYPEQQLRELLLRNSFIAPFLWKIPLEVPHELQYRHQAGENSDAS
jgi:hypothetical protein